MTNPLTGQSENEVSKKRADTTDQDDDDPLDQQLVDSSITVKVLFFKLIEDSADVVRSQKFDQTSSKHERYTENKTAPLFTEDLPEQVLGVFGGLLIPFLIAGLGLFHGSSFVSLTLGVGIGKSALDAAAVEIVQERVFDDELLLILFSLGARLVHSTLALGLAFLG